MERIVETQLSRRQAIGTIGVAVGVSLVPSLALAASSAGAQTAPVSCISTGISHTELGSLLAEMRRTRGCLSVRALAGADGKLAVWQDWQSGAAQSNFWASYEPGSTPNTFQKLNL
jgi:hypothetical protein